MLSNDGIQFSRTDLFPTFIDDLFDPASEIEMTISIATTVIAGAEEVFGSERPGIRGFVVQIPACNPRAANANLTFGIW